MKKVFIFSTGRCGSTSIANTLADLPGVLSGHEGIFFLNKKRVRLPDLKSVNEQIYYSSNSNFDYSKSVSPMGKEFVSLVEKEFRSRMELIKNIDRKGFDIFVESNPYMYSCIDYIYKIFPDAYFVHLIRSGYDVAVSYFYRKVTSNKGGGVRHYSCYPEDIKESEYYSYISGKPRPLLSDPSYNAWGSYSRMQKMAWFWSYVNNDISKRMSNIPKRQRSIMKLEDLSASSLKETLNIIYGKERAPNYISKTKDKAYK